MQSDTDRSSMRSNLECAAWFLLWSLPALAMAQAESKPGLVEKLANNNSPPTIQGKPGDQKATGGKGTRAESERIDAAVKEVIDQSEDLWSELVDHLGDDRYCKTVGIDAGYPKNWSVGDMCQHIIGETLSEPYYRDRFGRKQDFHRFRLPAMAKDKVMLREWCLARKDRQLFELQIEVCEWAISEINDSAKSAEEKQRLTRAIEEEIEGLKRSKKAIHLSRSF